MKFSRRAFFSFLPAGLVASALPKTFLEDSDWLPHGAVLLEHNGSKSTGIADPFDELSTLGWKANWQAGKCGNFIVLPSRNLSWRERAYYIARIRKDVRRVYAKVHA